MNKIINLKKEKKISKKYTDISNLIINYSNKNINNDLLNDLSNNLFNNLVINKFNPSKQIEFINSLYLNINFTEKKELLCNLSNKINSYKQQDIKKQINHNNIINIDEVIKKLLISKLKCYYCKKNLLLFYSNVREDYQWTLDRIDNNINHSNDNTLISCLSCNLKRRTKNKNDFLFTKQLKIIKNY